MRTGIGWLGTIVAAAAMAAPAHADITVADPGDSAGVDGHCTLREAFAAAAAPGTPSADCPGASASGTTTIRLTASPRLNVGEISVPSGAQVSLVGTRPDQSDGGTSVAPVVFGSQRFLHVSSGATVSISAVLIEGFTAPTGTFGTAGPNATTRGGNGLNGGTAGVGGDGGAIVNAGTLHLTNVHLDFDTAGAGGAGQAGGTGAMGVDSGVGAAGAGAGAGGHGGDGGQGGAGGSGGAVANSGTLTIDSSEFKGDAAGVGGVGGPGGTGGAGGPTPLNHNGTAGPGGAGGTGGIGGGGGGGGAIFNTGTVTITDTAISATAGAAGVPGAGGTGGLGADGYPSGFMNTVGGDGGAGGTAGSGDYPGGSGGALLNGFGATMNLTGATITGSAGAGAKPATAGVGGQAGFGDTEGVTGHGGTGGRGSDGGSGGAITNVLGTLVVSQSAVGGQAGDGGTGGDSAVAGAIRSDSFRGPTVDQTYGLPGTGGRGGDGGNGGALELQGSSTITNTSFVPDPPLAYTIGAGDGGGGGHAATGHTRPGAAGGAGGDGGSGGAIDASAAVTLTHDTIGSGTPGASGSGNAGGNGVPAGASGANGTTGTVGGIRRSTAGAQVTERNTIVAYTTGAGCGTGVIDGAGNVSGDGTCPGTHVDPLLNYDSSDGIPVLGLQSGSPAIDTIAATGANCPAQDERGAPRPQGAKCDAGAFERAAAPACSNQTVDVPYDESVDIVPVCTHASTRAGANRSATVAVVTAPAHGQALPFDPDSVNYGVHGYVGADSFTYKLTDGDGTSNLTTVTINVLPPAAPTITNTTPGSPSADAAPHVIGSAPVIADAISLFTSADCSGTPAVTGTRAHFASPGLVVTVPENAATPITARYATSDNVDSPCSAPMVYVHDTLAPDTLIDGGPSGSITDTRPVFAFHATEAGVSFECSLDQGTAAFRACSGPGASDQPTLPLGAGGYTFRVRARDTVGNLDASPATRDFTVAGLSPGPSPSPTPAAGPPDTILTKHPKARIKTKRKTVKVRFAFRSSPAGATFTCKLDKHKAKRCRGKAKYKVRRGRHVFTVTARTSAGPDPTPARFRFRVKKKR